MLWGTVKNAVPFLFSLTRAKKADLRALYY